MIRAIDLRTEYLKNPCALDIPFPRLSWKVEGAVRQTAFQVKASADGRVIYDSGQVVSSAMNDKYRDPLESRSRNPCKIPLSADEAR